MLGSLKGGETEGLRNGRKDKDVTFSEGGFFCDLIKESDQLHPLLQATVGDGGA